MKLPRGSPLILHEPRPGAFDRLLARRRVGDLHRARALGPEQPSGRRLAGGERGFVRGDGDVVGEDADAQLGLVGIAEEARLDAHRKEQDRDAVVETLDPPPRIADRRARAIRARRPSMPRSASRLLPSAASARFCARNRGAERLALIACRRRLRLVDGGLRLAAAAATLRLERGRARAFALAAERRGAGLVFAQSVHGEPEGGRSLIISRPCTATSTGFW